MVMLWDVMVSESNSGGRAELCSERRMEAKPNQWLPWGGKSSFPSPFCLLNFSFLFPHGRTCISFKTAVPTSLPQRDAPILFLFSEATTWSCCF